MFDDTTEGMLLPSGKNGLRNQHLTTEKEAQHFMTTIVKQSYQFISIIVLEMTWKFATNILRDI